MFKRFIIITIILLIFLTSLTVSTKQTPKSKPKTFEAKIHGGITKTKSMALWELQRYRDTTLMAKSPLCYAPWRAYIAVDKYVEVSMVNDCNALIIHKDITKEVATDATFNRQFCKRFEGRSLKGLYRYCRRTKYVIHTKTAREVFEQRKGDCAGISSAFYVMCRTNHIPVHYIIGWADGECHAWNKVKYQGKWYYIDCTLGLYLSRKLWSGYSIMEEW